MFGVRRFGRYLICFLVAGGLWRLFYALKDGHRL